MAKKKDTYADMIITGRYCDEPMAEKKGFIETCRKDCRNCICCIVKYENGTKEHINLLGTRKGENTWI